MVYLSVENLCRSYEQEGRSIDALKDVSFGLQKGVSLAISGSSGAGKSTLLNMIGGFDVPTTGTVRVNGVDIHALSDKDQAEFRHTKLGFVFQFHHLLEDFSILENVMMPLLIQNGEERAAHFAAMAILEKVGLAGLEQRFPQEVSGGEQQRAAIARAVVHRPEIILADEPTGNLDEANSEKVFELLCGLNHDLSSTLIVVTHQDHFAGRLGGLLELASGHVVSFSEKGPGF